jgi:hypothetical protein
MAPARKRPQAAHLPAGIPRRLVADGQALEPAFDLHRFDLLTALHLPLPPNLVREVTANQELSEFLRQPSEYQHALTQAQRGLRGDGSDWEHGHEWQGTLS